MVYLEKQTKITSATQQKQSYRYLYLLVFTGGMTTLAIELSASRLLGNVFGTSNLVWANVIGLILLYLTAGYFIGGRWADHSPYAKTLYQIVLWAAFLGALIPLVARPVLTTAAVAFADLQAGLALGSFIAVLVLFSVPITLLGTISPFAIRLAIEQVEDSGKVAGQIYAISTLGSLIGTFLPVLFIIPTLGTIQTFLLFAGALYLIGFVGMWREVKIRALRWLWQPVLIVVLALVVLSGPLRPPPDGRTLLLEDESAYNYIQVQEDERGYRYLLLNEGQGVHSIWHPSTFIYEGTWDYFLAAPYFNTPPYTPNDVQSVLIIGLAGGTIARQYIHVYGDIPVDGVEIDPDIVAAGAQFFDMNEIAMPSLTVYVEDGRYVLRKLKRQYNVIAVDAYRPPYIPWHLTTVEFFQELASQLTDDGVVAINVGRTNSDRRLVDALTATMLQVFASVHAIDVPHSFNTILVATQQTTSQENLKQNLDMLAATTPSMLRTVLERSVASLVPLGQSDIIFTDNRAPVETLVDSLVLNFLLSGDTDQLRRD